MEGALSFDLREELLPDYAVINWYLSNHPNSLFVTQLIVARPGPGYRYALHNNEFTVHPLAGKTESRVLATAAELRKTLEGEFKLKLPVGPELDSALQRLAVRPTAGAQTASSHTRHARLPRRSSGGGPRSRQMPRATPAMVHHLGWTTRVHVSKMKVHPWPSISTS